MFGLMPPLCPSPAARATMTRITFLVLLWSLALPAGASLSCAWTKALPNGEVHLSFLRTDPRLSPPSQRLYQSHWSRERTARSCTWSDDATLIRDYLSRCQQRASGFSDRVDGSLDVDAMLTKRALCVPVASAVAASAKRRPVRSVNGTDEAQRSEVKSHRRVKRFIFPGTLWCGAGNNAPSYSALGVFSDTDSCCRDHDHCKYNILGSQKAYGIVNPNPFTISFCGCDNKFRRCLKAAKNSVSNMVGSMFFNVLKMQCFDLTKKPQCTQRNWIGVCKLTKVVFKAEIRQAKEYDPQSTEVDENLPDSGSTEKQLSCTVYKDLDECKDSIPPQQTKYGLQNPESSTLYHCDCTNRLFQTLSKQKQLTEIQTLLQGFVSPSCFQPKSCAAGKTCTPDLVTPDLPKVRSPGVKKRRRLEAAKQQVMKENDGVLLLNKLCLQLSRPKLN